jgi:phosphate-selective porin OprO and OprP
MTGSENENAGNRSNHTGNLKFNCTDNQEKRESYRRCWRLVVVLMIGVSLVSNPMRAQEAVKQVPNGTDGLTLPVRDDTARNVVKKLPVNDFEGSKASFRIGMGFIYDFATYAQSDVFKQQMDSGNFKVGPKALLRDFRVLGSMRFKTKRTLTFKFAYMWDGNNQTWLVRESGLTIGVPELAGHIFIGRTKEGYSMVKVMNGHSPWTNERQMAIDLIPILADGIKWFGHLPKSRVFWNLGLYNDIVSHRQSFSTFAWQAVARVGWLPVYNTEESEVVHVAANLRYGEPENGKFTAKSRPESNPMPHILNTGEFNASTSRHIGGELYYSKKNFMIGSEVAVHQFYSTGFEDHTFIGGDVMFSYMFTGGIRPYNQGAGIYGFIPVKNPVFKGGLGELEGVLHASTYNLNDGSIKGGQFWRFTSMVNW